MSTVEDRLVLLDALTLERGAHKDFLSGACVMEAAAWVAGRPFSDHPPCVSPVIGAFLRTWNDQLDNEGRQDLKRLIPLILNTADEHDEQRAWMAADWLVRVHTPAWLELAGVKDAAAALRALPELRDTKSAKSAQPTIKTACTRATAAGAAARAAAWDAARAAAWAVAWAAAGAAAWAAAWDAAWDAARAAAWDAARAAAWDAARDAAWAALEPTVVELKASAMDLVERMCAIGRPTS